jgi:hypothetical protein
VGHPFLWLLVSGAAAYDGGLRGSPDGSGGVELGQSVHPSYFEFRGAVYESFPRFAVCPSLSMP